MKEPNIFESLRFWVSQSVGLRKSKEPNVELSFSELNALDQYILENSSLFETLQEKWKNHLDFQMTCSSVIYHYSIFFHEKINKSSAVLLILEGDKLSLIEPHLVSLLPMTLQKDIEKQHSFWIDFTQLLKIKNFSINGVGFLSIQEKMNQKTFEKILIYSL